MASLTNSYFGTTDKKKSKVVPKKKTKGNPEPKPGSMLTPMGPKKPGAGKKPQRNIGRR